MKLKLVVVALILIAVSLIGISYRDYQNHKKVVTAQKQSFASLQKELYDSRKANAALVVQYNAQNTQCLNGLNAYKVLTPAEKATVAKSGVIEPVCAASIAE